MASITASRFTTLLEAFRLAAAALTAPPSPILDDIAPACESLVSGGAPDGRNEQVLAAYRATLRPICCRGIGPGARGDSRTPS